MILGTLGASLLGNMLPDKGVIRAGWRTIRTGEGTNKVVSDFSIAPHPLTNVEIQIYHQNEPRFNSFQSRNNLPKKKNGAYIINFEEYESAGTNWIALHVTDGNATEVFSKDSKIAKIKNRQY